MHRLSCPTILGSRPAWALIWLVSAGCQADRSAPPIDPLTKACARCDACNPLDGAICYAELAETLHGEGKLALADEKLKVAAEKMLAAEEAHEPPESLIEGLTRLAAAQFTLGQRQSARAGLDRALSLVDQIKSPNQKSDRLVLIAEAQHKARQTTPALASLQQAESLAAAIPDRLAQCDILGRVARVYAALGRTADAERAVYRALESARAEHNPHPSAALAAVALALDELGKHDEATRIFTEARTAAESQSDLLKRTTALGEVGKSLAQAKRWDRAEEILTAAIQASLQAKDQSVAEPLRNELSAYLQKCRQADP